MRAKGVTKGVLMVGKTKYKYNPKSTTESARKGEENTGKQNHGRVDGDGTWNQTQSQRRGNNPSRSRTGRQKNDPTAFAVGSSP